MYWLTIGILGTTPPPVAVEPAPVPPLTPPTLPPPLFAPATADATAAAAAELEPGTDDNEAAAAFALFTLFALLLLFALATRPPTPSADDGLFRLLTPETIVGLLPLLLFMDADDDTPLLPTAAAAAITEATLPMLLLLLGVLLETALG